jgi:uncharacterized glyoxalase superfamily protein PhnB
MSNQTIFPALRYHDAPAAIDWLERAFGFERRMVVEGDGGIVEHAELVLGDSMIMLGSVRPPEAGAYSKVAPGPGSSSLYAVVDDPDGVHARAVQAGADIVSGLVEQDYGSREFTARDPEGNVWTFGTYRPWASAESGAPQASSVGEGGGTL